MTEEEERELQEQRAREEEIRREQEEQRAESERIERERQEEEARRAEEEESKRREAEEEQQRYISDKHCAYCTHLIPDKREGRMFYCDKQYTYVGGSSNACREYEEAGRSTLISDQIYSDQYGFEAEERDCAFCTHLIPDKKSEGRYYCDKLSTYVKGTDSNKSMGCGAFEEAGRSRLESEVIRDDSEVLDAHSESFFGKKVCAECRYFNIDTSDDKQGGGYYMCTKRNQQVPADQEECYMFESSGRSSAEVSKALEDVKESKKNSEKPKNDDNGFFLKLALCGVVIIIIIILKVLKIM